MKTQTIPVYEITHEELAETGHEVGDGGAGERELYASLMRRNLMSRLTPTQRRVIICTSEEGLTRRETARKLLVSLQSIHQIIARIKERFPEEDERLVKNLTWFYWMVHPGADVRVIARQWHHHPVLKDYRKPHDATLSAWYRRFHDLSLSRSQSAAGETHASAPRRERRERGSEHL